MKRWTDVHTPLFRAQARTTDRITEMVQLNEMKVTIEGLKDGIAEVGGTLSGMNNVVTRTEATLNGFYSMSKDS